ncbi:hypothetical protein M595_2487 [Lyngbya aestuarii BL J]|uniref:Uncharacterized protein n=1 Tax=Lyngbya aestuarii BL J TaxID=1348334 RepID=U7QMD0_9CYAN|nr:hypothetical protein [Lyngbya aestuarii]ERT07561.1 hypothetical protein M595_2487 [Lyngbya aestuarii BL J]
MDLDQQIQALIDNAPQDGTTPGVIEAIAPALKTLAQQLKHHRYYILQATDKSWVLTTLSHLDQPDVHKQVIYAYPTPEDASNRSPISGVTDVVATPIAVTHILFQMVALQPLESIIFFEIPGNLDKGTEVKRTEVQDLIRVYLERYRATVQSRNIPPNLA